MTRLFVLIAGMTVAWTTSWASLGQASEFTDAEATAAERVLNAHFAGKPGAIVVGLVDAEGSRVFAVGGLDDGSERRADGDTVFFIGSVSKTFTALLLAEMAARGEVKLEDPVAKYLPASVTVPSRGGKQITLFQLATNSSGLRFNPENMTGADVREQYETYTVDKMYAYLESFSLPRDPGAEYEYSNLGMSLLGDALARRAGKSYNELIVERTCAPLGMTNTRATPTPEMLRRLAMGRDEAGESTGPFQLDAYAPAGGIHSTANDLLIYAAAQAGISRTAVTGPIAQTHEIQFEDVAGYGGGGLSSLYGRTAMPWMDRGALQPPGMELLAHAGGAGSYHAWVGFDAKQRRGVVVLSTANDLSVEAVGWTLLQRAPLDEARLHDFAREMIGIGTALELTDDATLRITAVLPNSPAEQSGLVAGSIITTVDDVATTGKDLAACVGLIRGPAGTKVQLDVYDPATRQTRTVELTRRRFHT